MVETMYLSQKTKNRYSFAPLVISSSRDVLLSSEKIQISERTNTNSKGLYKWKISVRKSGNSSLVTKFDGLFCKRHGRIYTRWSTIYGQSDCRFYGLNLGLIAVSWLVARHYHARSNCAHWFLMSRGFNSKIPNWSTPLGIIWISYVFRSRSSSGFQSCVRWVGAVYKSLEQHMRSPEAVVLPAVLSPWKRALS